MLPPEKQRIAQEMATEIQKHEGISFENALEKSLRGVKIDINRNVDKNKTCGEIQETQSVDNQVIDNKMQNMDNLKNRILNHEYQKQINKKAIINRIKSNLGNKKRNVNDERANHRRTYVYMFVDYLIDNLFADKKIQFKTTYYNDIVDYVHTNYFQGCNTMKAVEFRWSSYQYRIDVAAKYIEKYKAKDSFNDNLLYPLAYLNIFKKGKGHFSFANTEIFTKNGNSWKQKNGYNRKLNSELKKKLNKYARDVEMGKDTYDNALENIKNLTEDNTELVKQFNLRMQKHFILTNKNYI